ncbi:MAG: hypothetical protein MJ237_06170 [bacterium]|nr:hypothetical protein [bacterium]
MTEIFRIGNFALREVEGFDNEKYLEVVKYYDNPLYGKKNEFKYNEFSGVYYGKGLYCTEASFESKEHCITISLIRSGSCEVEHVAERNIDKVSTDEENDYNECIRRMIDYHNENYKEKVSDIVDEGKIDSEENKVKILASHLALQMYDNMCEELITSLTNIEKIKEGLMWRCAGNRVEYMHGMKDAFGEIADRVIKERYLGRSIYDADTEVYNELEKIYRSDMDKEFNYEDSLFRGRRNGIQLIRRLTGKIANLLQKYIYQGFYLGSLHERFNGYCEKGLMSADEIRKKLINIYVPELKKEMRYGHSEEDMVDVWSKEDWQEIINGTF